MKQTFSANRIGLRAVGIVLLSALTIAMLLWEAGVYDVWFLKRHQTSQQPVYDIPSEEPQHENTVPLSFRSNLPISNLYRVHAPAATENTIENYTAMLHSYAECPDNAQTDAALTYQSGKSSLVRLNIAALPHIQTSGTKQQRQVIKTVLDDQYHTSFSVVYTEVARSAVEIYGGYLIVAENDSLRILDRNGNVLMDPYDCSYVPTGISDENGYVLFEKDAQYYTLTGGCFIQTDLDPSLQKWRLTCEVPLGYDADGTTTVYCEEDKWGYMDAAGNKLSEAIYLRAFPHREGLAIAYTAKNVLILDEQLQTIGSIPYETDDVFLTLAEVTIPQTFGAEYYGLNTFDHGLTVFRTRRNLKTYRVFNYTKISDDSRLYNRFGEQISQPQGYELVGYSDGMLLLKKEGEQRYGYMDCYGNWVVDPVFSYAGCFKQGLAVVGWEDGKKAVIDTDGNIVLPMCFSQISDVSRGMLAAWDEACGWVVFAISNASGN